MLESFVMPSDAEQGVLGSAGWKGGLNQKSVLSGALDYFSLHKPEDAK